MSFPFLKAPFSFAFLIAFYRFSFGFEMVITYLTPGETSIRRTSQKLYKYIVKFKCNIAVISMFYEN